MRGKSGEISVLSLIPVDGLLLPLLRFSGTSWWLQLWTRRLPAVVASVQDCTRLGWAQRTAHAACPLNKVDVTFTSPVVRSD